jgi:hypothetical protein
VRLLAVLAMVLFPLTACGDGDTAAPATTDSTSVDDGCADVDDR